MRLSVTALLATATIVTPALAQRTATFDSASVGSLPVAAGVTFQLYNPVTGNGFAWPTSGGAYIGGGVVAIPSTSTGTRGIQTPVASAGFSPEGMRLLFNVDQARVRFTVGVGEPNVLNAVYRVQGYNASNTLVFSRDYPVGSGASLHCNTLVDIDLRTVSPRVRRVDIISLIQTSGANGEYREVLDSLEYVADLTPPELVINTPANDTCVSPTVLIITGFSQDIDGQYFDEVWDYSTSPVGPWTNIGVIVSPFPAPGGNLVSWNTSAVPAGWYFVRGMARNVDGLTTQVMRRIFIDRAPPVIDLRGPASGAIVGGSVCFDGSVGDNVCGNVSYSMGYRPAGSGSAFTTFATGSASVTNDPLGTWNTRSPLVPDGNYEVQLTATDGFGNTSSVTRVLTVDNLSPASLISNLVACEGIGADGPVLIQGTVFDQNLSGWALQYTTGAGFASSSWVTIATGTSNITGVLGVLNTASLPACAATIRLIVNDRAVVNCNTNNSQTYQVSVRIKRPGVCSDIDFNNNGVFPEDQDVLDFFNVLAGGSCGG